MADRTSSAVFRYALAAMAICAAVLLRIIAGDWLGASTPFVIIMVPAVAIATLFAGVGPGILATVLCALAVVIPIGSRSETFAIRDPRDIALLVMFLLLSALLIAIVHMARVQRHRVESFERQLAEELEDMQHLHEVSTQLVRQGDLHGLLGNIIDTAIRITRADKGNIQLYDPATQSLHIVAQRGFEQPFLEFFASVPHDVAARGSALRCGKRVVVEDITRSDIFADTPALQVLLQAGVRAVQSTPLISRDGSLVGMMSTYYSQPLRLPERELRLLDLLARQAADLIEQKQAEKQLRQRDDQLRIITNTVPALISYVDSEFRYRQVNQACERWFGQKPEQIWGRHVSEVLGETAWEAVRPYMHRAMAGETVSFERQLPYGNNGPIWAHLTFTPDIDAEGRVRGFVELVTDITERKQAEEALANSEREFRAIFELAGSGKAQLDPTTSRFTRVNRKLCEITGYSQQELLERTYLDITHPEDRAADLERFLAVMQGGEDTWVSEKRFIRKDGRIAWVLVTGRVIRDAHGWPMHGIATIQDITERKFAEESLRASEARYRTLAETAPVHIFHADQRGALQWASRSFLHYTGVSEPEQLDATLRSQNIVHPDDQQEVVEQWERGIAAAVPIELELRIRRADGEYRWHLCRVTPVRDQHGEVIEWVGTCTDIHDRKLDEQMLNAYKDRLEELVAERTSELEKSYEALRLSDRMASLGTLSAGIGHDIGNLLLPIRARLDVLRQMELSDEMRTHLDAIGESAKYLRELASGLRLFAIDPEQQHSEVEQLDLHQWCQSTCRFYQSVLPKNIHMVHEVPEGLPLVSVSEAGLTQAVFNLVNNARDAIGTSRRGRIVLRARELPDEKAIRVTVEDDGPGMSPEVRDRCIEPFFTTKSRGISTGLGLSLVHNVAAAAGGRIEIESPVASRQRFQAVNSNQNHSGGGTAISIVLPVASPAPSHETHPRAHAALVNGEQTPASTEHRHACVTVADLRVRGLISTLLSAAGFEVKTGTEPTTCNDSGPAAIMWVADANPVNLAHAQRLHAAMTHERSSVSKRNERGGSISASVCQVIALFADSQQEAGGDESASDIQAWRDIDAIVIEGRPTVQKLNEAISECRRRLSSDASRDPQAITS